MSYRGDDLDLRTPQTWSATPSELASATDYPLSGNGPRGGLRTGPILVDDAVLACCNHAFEIALAHRAGEVRIEHLLHAMTRIDAAAEALEARGVRVAALRRESATIIASEIPVVLPNGKGTPRRSEEFADVLRIASGNAARRNAPASVEDILQVIIDQRPDLPGLNLLARHLSRGYARDTIEPLPPLSRYSPEPRYTPSMTDRYLKAPSNEGLRYTLDAGRGYRSEYSGTPTDSIQNTRIEALEQIVRALSHDLANERQVVSGMLKDLSRDNQAHSEDQGLLHTGLYDRMQNLEQAVTQSRSGGSPEGLVEQLQGIEAGLEQRLNDMSQSWSVLSARLQDLELAVRQSSGDKGSPGQLIERIKQAIDLGPIANRLDIIEEAVLSNEPGAGSAVAGRLKALEDNIARVLSANSASSGRMETLLSGFERQKPEALGPLVERISSLVGSYQTIQTSAKEQSEKLAERMSAVERALAAEIETAAAKHQAYARDLTEVHDALMKLNQNQHTLAGSIDQWRTDAAGDTAVISNRLASLDRDNERPIETLDALTAHMDTMNKLMVERYHRRNRFWYWLFGTDDWIGQSWPSQAKAIETERQRLKAPQRA